MAENVEVKQNEELDPEIEAHSKELLNSLIVEFKTAKWFPTHVGTIVAVRKDSDNKRYYVLKYADGYVYMPEAEMNQAINEEEDVKSLKGATVPFKVLSVDGDYIIVSNLFCIDMYKLALKSGSTMTGTIISSSYNREDPKQSYFQVSAYGDLLTMMVTDYTIYSTPKYLPAQHNEKLDFKVLSVEDNGLVYISHAVIQAEQRDRVIEDIKNKPQGFIATILKVTDSAAYLSYHGVLMIMRNRDFSTDYTPIGMVKHKGDQIIVRLHHVSQTSRIFVEPVEKYKSLVNPEVANSFHYGQKVTGVVTGVSSWGLFVRIAPGLDMLCSIPAVEPERGDTVAATVTHVVSGSFGRKTRIRGVINTILKKNFVEDDEDVIADIAQTAQDEQKENKENA